MQCPKCGATERHKAGFVNKIQRYRCKHCHCQYTRSTPKGRSPQEKHLALELYLSGISMNRIGQLLGVSTPAVLKWIRQLEPLSLERPEVSSATVVELDELCHVLGQKNEKYGFGLLFAESPVASLTGKLVIVEAGR